MLTNCRRWVALVATVGLILMGSATVVAHPQSLGDVARREAERRKDASRTPGRVYTNEDLGPVEPAASTPLQPAPTAPAGTAEEPNEVTAEAASPGPTVMEEDPETHKVNIRTTAPRREKRDEPYWRSRAKDVRDRLAKATADLTAAQSSLAALDGGPKTPATARERSVVSAAVERLQSEVRYRQQDVTKMQMHAEMNKVPTAWIQ
ncbi:MAG: hypothetical protein ABW292_18695 [Vicinamibacterales bacterium]